MGFNKRIISKDSLKIYAKYGDYNRFLKCFESDVLIFEDDFSYEISKEILMCKNDDKDKIINIMNKCK